MKAKAQKATETIPMTVLFKGEAVDLDVETEVRGSAFRAAPDGGLERVKLPKIRQSKALPPSAVTEAPMIIVEPDHDDQAAEAYQGAAVIGTVPPKALAVKGAARAKRLARR